MLFQTIRRRVDNGKKSGEIVVDTAGDLGLPHTSYQLTLSVGEFEYLKLIRDISMYFHLQVIIRIDNSKDLKTCMWP